MGMYPITIQVPDELAGRLRRRAADLPHILELGLREVEAQGQLQFDGAADVLDFLATLPDPSEVLALRPSSSLQARIEFLLERNREAELTPQESQELAQIERLEHLVRMAKARARAKLDE
jgi:hypothetical protein